MAISTGAGTYDAKQRILHVSTYANQQWAYDGTNSTWQGFCWSLSGAAAFNAVLALHIDYHILLDEVCYWGLSNSIETKASEYPA